MIFSKGVGEGELNLKKQNSCTAKLAENKSHGENLVCKKCFLPSRSCV